MNTKESNPADRPKAALPNFAEGQKLAGCYVLRRRVEAGGGAVIWLAHDQVLGKDVSLHFIPAEIRATTATMDAIRQEVKKNRQLIHPNILRVYDFVEEEEWSAVSMDWFEGDSLAAALARNQAGFFEPVDIKPWVGQLCATLEDAHKVQLVHRDIGLTNIFVEKSGRIIVANFGISRCIQDALGRLRGAEDPDLGVAFMSPQQLDGERASQSDDIYSLGVLLYALLTGEAPFAGRDIVAKIRRVVPQTVTERRAQLKKSGGLVPPAWEKTIAACMEKTPEQRPKNMGEIASRMMIEKAIATVEGVPVIMPAPAPALMVAPTPESAVAEAPEPAKSALRPVDILRAKAKAAEAGGLQAAANEPPAQKPTEVALPKPEPERVEKPPVPPESEQDVIPDHYPSFKPRRSGFPLTGLAAAVILVAIGIYGTFFYNSEQGSAPVTDLTGIDREPDEIAPVANVAANQTSPPEIEAVEPNELAPVPQLTAVAPELTATPTRLAQNSTKVETRTAPANVTVTTAPADASAAAAALEKAKKEAEAAQKLQEEMLKQKQQAETAAADAKKLLDERTKAALPIQKAASEVATLLQKRDEEMKAAQTAAEEAQRLAAEKVKMAEDAKKALANVEAEGREKLAAQQKSDAELKALQKALEDKQQQFADAQKAITDAAAQMEAQKAAIKRAEQDLAESKLAAQKAAEEASRMAMEKRRLVETEIEETKRLFAEKMQKLEEMLNKGASVPPAPASAPAVVSPPPPIPNPAPAKTDAPPTTPTAAVKNPPASEQLLVMKSDPAKVPVLPPGELKSPAAPVGLENSLGMKFIPVGDVMFSIYQTRVQDFEAFAKATGLKSSLWKDPGFKQGPDHPVVNVTWQDAVVFCKWLSVKEHKEGVLPANQIYRLPTDLEWSRAVGLPEESGKTPEARDMGVPDVYPWGTAWPPPPGSGNYTGEETGSDVAIKGYDDGFAWTSPVGSFPPNKSGLYDMGGNVWQWCLDSWNKDEKAKVLRGASWYNGAFKLSLLSSCRVHAAPDSSTDNYGFRCVIATAEQGKAPKKP